MSPQGRPASGRTYVARSTTVYGRGVFAAEPIAAGEVIEECPVIRVPGAQLEHLGSTLVDEYYFSWEEDGAIALGHGSLYNHSSTPNAEYLKDIDDDVLTVRALTDIAAGEEIAFDYAGPSGARRGARPPRTPG